MKVGGAAKWVQPVYVRQQRHLRREMDGLQGKLQNATQGSILYFFVVKCVRLMVLKLLFKNGMRLILISPLPTILTANTSSAANYLSSVASLEKAHTSPIR